MADANKEVSNVIERHDEYQKYARENYYGELQEVWQGINCRTKPMYKLDSAGKETTTEDKTRTNVAMTDLAVMYWRNLARMSAQPYRMRYIGGNDPFIADAFSSLTRKQYDRSNEVIPDTRRQMASEAFGVGYTKLYEDVLSRVMKFRRAIMKGDQVAYRDRASIMKYQGAPDDEIDGAVADKGNDMSDDEISQFLSSDRGAKQIVVPTEIKKYEGPCVKFVFPGNLLISPRALTLNESESLIEYYQESDLWLKWMVARTYKNPKTGKIEKIFDPAAADGLLVASPDPKAHIDDLRSMFDAATGKDTDESYRFPVNLRIRKKFNIYEEHYADEDGMMWIVWVSPDYREKVLGKMCYPWDLYGSSVYTEEVPLPDLCSAFGNSTPRLNRHLFKMHNRIVAQNFDYITNLIKKLFLRKTGTEVSEEVVRGMFREIVTNNPEGLKPMEEGQLPVGAMEREQQVIRMMSMLETSMAATDSGTTTNPMAGKTATSQRIAASISDALLQFKVAGRDLYIRQLGQKKLWMNQQCAEDSPPWDIESQYFNEGLNQKINALPKPPDDPKQMESYKSELPAWALSDRFGKVSAVRLDPVEIQEDLDVEPESMSYMAVDDDIRRSDADRIAVVAAAAPGVVDERKVARLQLSTIRSVKNPDDLLKPEAPPDPLAGIKVGLNVAVPMKFEDLPADVQKQILARLGMQITPAVSGELDAEQLTKGVTKLSTAADSATNLLSPATPPEEPGAGKGKPPKKAKQ